MDHFAKNLKWTVFILVFIFLLSSPLSSHSKEKIRIGNTISLSGPYASGAVPIQVEPHTVWVEDVNAKGGIFVKSLGKRLPVELITYDDRSDIGTAIKFVEKMILDDKVDLLLPPFGTAMNLAIAPIANKHKHPVIGTSFQSEKLREIMHTIPYYFAMLSQHREQGAALVDLLKELKIEKVAIIYVADAYGIEATGIIAPAIGVAGMEVAIFKSYPLGVKDLSPLLKTIKAAEVDALIAFSYPGDTFLITEQARSIGLNPKLFYCAIGSYFPGYRDRFGARVVEGVMGPGVWNPKLPYPGAREFFDRYVKRWNKEPVRWGGGTTYASLQVLEQAIEITGSLDRSKLREAIAKETFSSTVAGPVKFVDGFNIHSPGEIGQWQKGEFEVIAPKEKRKVPPIFPKSPWP